MHLFGIQRKSQNQMIKIIQHVGSELFPRSEMNDERQQILSQQYRQNARSNIHHQYLKSNTPPKQVLKIQQFNTPISKASTQLNSYKVHSTNTHQPISSKTSKKPIFETYEQHFAKGNLSPQINMVDQHQSNNKSISYSLYNCIYSKIDQQQKDEKMFQVENKNYRSIIYHEQLWRFSLDGNNQLQRCQEKPLIDPKIQHPFVQSSEIHQHNNRDNKQQKYEISPSKFSVKYCINRLKLQIQKLRSQILNDQLSSWLPSDSKGERSDNKLVRNFVCNRCD